MNAELQSLAQTFKEKAGELSALSDKANEAFSEYEDTGRSEIGRTLKFVHIHCAMK